MTKEPYRPTITNGDLRQTQSGCNITQPAGAFSANLPTAAEVAAAAQARYTERHAQVEAYKRAKEAQKGQPSANSKR